MNFNKHATSCQNAGHLNKKPAVRSIIILLLFAAAFGIRLYHINRPPLDFAPIRQYQNAHIIRGLYYETNDSISESEKRIAKLNMERMGFVLEPRIIENAAILGYRITGGEHLWIPRVLSSIFWVVGGFFLYLIARTLFSQGISLFSTTFYLFLPYAILSSRSIQPDPLMVMLMLAGIYGIIKYDEKPSLPRLISAAVVTALAVLVKPYCIFIIFGVFFSLVVLRKGFWKALLNRDTVVFGMLIILPSLFHYVRGLLTGAGFLGEHARGSFLPHLILSFSFWNKWLIMIGSVVGYIAFFLAISGLLKIQQGRPKALLLGLWAGYFLFGLSATYQIHTHSYYSIPLIPIVALSLGPIAALARNHMSPFLSKRFLIIGSLIVLFILGLLSLRPLSVKNIISDYKSGLKTVATLIGFEPEFSKFLKDDFDRTVRMSKEIGEHIGHSTDTIFLDPNFGRVIAYHGEFAGLPWPTKESLYERRLRGTRVPDIKEDFTRDKITILYQGEFIEYRPDFFIITAFDEFERQPDLKDFLNSNFPILAQNDAYLIFDLRKMSE